MTWMAAPGDAGQALPAGKPKRSRRKRLRRAILLTMLAAIVFATYFFWPRTLPAAPPFPSQGASVESGRYLATIGNCSACHSVEGRPAYAGGNRFETPFGIIFSTNITADREYGIGAWTYAQFHTAMRHGLRPDGSHLYPAFPYTAFSQLSDTDVASLFLYLRTIQPAAVAATPNELSFPFNNRSLLHFWKRLFLTDRPFVLDAGQSESWNRGAYLVRAIAHCGACHTPRNMLGAERESLFLHGGTYVDQVASGAYRQWAAVDLTPGSQGLGAWNAGDIADYLTSGINRHSVVHGPMNEVVASTRQLSPQDAQAIATYLTGIAPSPERSERWITPRRFTEGQVVYTVHCGTCHLPEGRGDTVLGVSLAGNPIVNAPDPSSLINVILYGPQLPPPPFTVSRTRMRPFGRRLSNEDIAAVATYVRNSFGNRASPVSPQQVRDQR